MIKSWFALVALLWPLAAMADAKHAHAIGEPGDPAKAGRTVEVLMTDEMRFVPDRISVRKGETVRFVVKNVGAIKHEFVLGRPKDLVEHAKLMQKHPDMEHDDPNGVGVEPGKTGELVWRFTKGGRIDFGCLHPGHFEAGMKGRIVFSDK